MKISKKQKAREEALEKINDLFKQAKSNPEKANLYVKKARKIGMKVNLPMPNEYKRKFCKHCYNYFQDKNYRVRTRNKMVVYYCLNCKKYMKFKMIIKNNLKKKSLLKLKPKS